MSYARRGAFVPLAIAVGGVLLASAPASATVKATWSKPTDNSTYTSTSPIDFIVALDRGLITDGAAVYLNLAVPGPSAGPFRVDTASGSDKELKFTFTPACPNHTGACAGGSAPAYNGRYTATLSGAVTATRTVVLQVPPAAPGGVTAVATGQRRVKVSWDANKEPDLTSYDVFTAEGNTIVTNLPTSTLSFEFDLPSSGYGGEHRYVVRANRLACSNCSGTDGGATLASPVSAPASVTLTEPGAEPDPDSGTGSGDGSTTDPGTGGDGSDDGYNGDTGSNGSGSGNNGNGKGNGGSGTSTGTDANGYNTGATTGGDFSSGQTQAEQTKAAQQKLAFGLTFKSFAPKLGAPKLPPLPQFDAPTEQIPWGTYDPTLNYGDKTVTEKDQIASGGGITDTLVDTFSIAFEGQRLYRSMAIALLLLLAAAHLRVWLRHTPQ